MRKYSMSKVLTALCNKGYLELKGVDKDVKQASLTRKLSSMGVAPCEVFYRYFTNEYPALYTYKPGKVRGMYELLAETGVVAYYEAYPAYLTPKKLIDYMGAVFRCFVHILSNKERRLDNCTPILDKCSFGVRKTVTDLGFDSDAEIKRFLAKPIDGIIPKKDMDELMVAYSVRPRLGVLDTALDYAKATWESELMLTADKDMYNRYWSNSLSKYHTYEGVARALDFSYNYARHLFETYMSTSILRYTRKHHRSMSAEDLCIVLDYLYVGSDLGEYLGNWDMQLRSMGVTSAESIEELANQTGKSINEVSDMVHDIFEDVFPMEEEEEDKLFITLNAHLKHALMRGGVRNDADVVNFLKSGETIRNVGVKGIEKLKELYAEKLK